MEIIPEVKKNLYRLEIDLAPYLYDHHFEGRAILPAAEALIIMAKAVKILYPEIHVLCLSAARFPRFLALMPDAKKQTIMIKLKKGESDVSVALLTAVKAKTNKISRMIEHAFVEFNNISDSKPAPVSFRGAAKLSGACISIPSETIYRELVVFGKAYQNITGDLSVSSSGALGYLSAGEAQADEETLGSPFPFDALMHMACVWGQRFVDMVAFPVCFEKRIIYQQTRKEGDYLGRVVPKATSEKRLIFDGWIYDANGVLCEEITALEMRDVSGGRLRPPSWISG